MSYSFHIFERVVLEARRGLISLFCQRYSSPSRLVMLSLWGHSDPQAKFSEHSTLYIFLLFIISYLFTSLLPPLNCEHPKGQSLFNISFNFQHEKQKLNNCLTNEQASRHTKILSRNLWHDIKDSKFSSENKNAFLVLWTECPPISVLHMMCQVFFHCCSICSIFEWFIKVLM